MGAHRQWGPHPLPNPSTEGAVAEHKPLLLSPWERAQTSKAAHHPPQAPGLKGASGWGPGRCGAELS